MSDKYFIEYENYGYVDIVIKELMDEKGITKYEMAKRTGIRHQTVKNYYDNVALTKVDLDVISKMCYILDCDISDILKYRKPV